MFKNIFLVAIGGASGSILRYIISLFFNNNKFPYSTFSINIIGCFLIGILMGYFIKQQNTQTWQMLLVTGFCGGFTTFSTFSYDIVLMLQQTKYATALLYIFSTLLIGILFTLMGIYCIK